MIRKLLPTLILLGIALPGTSAADETTQIVQEALVDAGYLAPEDADGDPSSTRTVIAVSQVQTQMGLPPDGEITPQFAGQLLAFLNEQGQGAAAAPAPAAAESASAQPVDQAALLAAQQACLQRKMEEAQESNERRRGFRALARAASRVASRVGAGEISRDVAEISRDVYLGTSIAGDLSQAAEDLGLTESDLEECRNP